MHIGEKVKNIRVSLGLTQAEFAQKLGVTQSFISKVEQNKANFTIDHAREIGGRFNVDVSSLVQDKDIFLSESTAPYRPPDRDPVISQIVAILEEMNDEKRKEILKYVKREKQLADLLAERFGVK